MKRIAFLAVAIVSSLTACSDQPPFAPALEAPSARVVFNERQTFDAGFFNQCTGEVSFGELTIHQVVSQQERKDGGSTLGFHINFSYQGETATGVKYVANETINEKVEFSGTGTQSGKFVGHLNLIRQGSDTPEDDFYIFQSFSYTFDPVTGTFDIKRDELRVECK